MIRVKLPMGGVTPDQLDAFAAGIERYVPLRKGHITTRQNIQMHHIPLPDAAELIRELGDAGLSSREGCGNTVRNVTGDPRAGVLAGELFDITPYAGAYVRYFVRHPTTQAMPRKVKTAFAATDEDNAITRIHDMAFLPRLRDGVRGVEVRVGGGTSIMPRLAPTLYEFVELDNGDYLKVTEAVHPDLRPPGLPARQPRPRPDQGAGRQDRHRRLPRAGRGGAAGRLGRRARLLARRDPVRARRAGATPRPRRSARAPRTATSSEFDRFLATNVQAQRQAGLLDGRGQGPPRRPDARAAPRARRRSCATSPAATPAPPSTRTWCCAGSATRRSTTSGKRLAELGLGDAGADEITDVVSCPGTDSCKLGITSSMGLNQAVHERLVQMQIDDELTRRIHIKMSGCPNGCSQHHIANIGFYGASIKVGEHTIPAYIPHIGGSYEGGDVSFGAAAEEPAAGQARAGRGRALGPLLRGRAPRRRGVQRLRRAGRGRGSSRSRSGTWRCRSSSRWRT